MSGGHFDYRQYQLTEIIDEIKQKIIDNGREKTREELKSETYRDIDWYQKYPEDKFHYKYPEEVIIEFKNAVNIIQKAQTYIHRIDCLLSGDDGDESFLRRLKEDLNN